MFTIVVDTREQEPYEFPCNTISHKLEAGDYSVEGFESRIVVERKSLQDFVSTVVHQRDRFVRELVRLSAHHHACVVVEADMTFLLRRGEAFRVSAEAIMGASLWIETDYGVPVHWCGSRQGACWFTEHYLRRCVLASLDALILEANVAEQSTHTN